MSQTAPIRVIDRSNCMNVSGDPAEMVKEDSQVVDQDIFEVVSVGSDIDPAELHASMSTEGQASKELENGSCEPDGPVRIQSKSQASIDKVHEELTPEMDTDSDENVTLSTLKALVQKSRAASSSNPKRSKSPPNDGSLSKKKKAPKSTDEVSDRPKSRKKKVATAESDPNPSDDVVVVSETKPKKKAKKNIKEDEPSTTIKKPRSKDEGAKQGSGKKSNKKRGKTDDMLVQQTLSFSKKKSKIEPKARRAAPPPPLPPPTNCNEFFDHFASSHAFATVIHFLTVFRSQLKLDYYMLEDTRKLGHIMLFHGGVSLPASPSPLPVGNGEARSPDGADALSRRASDVSRIPNNPNPSTFAEEHDVLEKVMKVLTFWINEKVGTLGWEYGIRSLVKNNIESISVACEVVCCSNSEKCSHDIAVALEKEINEHIVSPTGQGFFHLGFQSRLAVFLMLVEFGAENNPNIKEYIHNMENEPLPENLRRQKNWYGTCLEYSGIRLKSIGMDEGKYQYFHLWNPTDTQMVSTHVICHKKTKGNVHGENIPAKAIYTRSSNPHEFHALIEKLGGAVPALGPGTATERTPIPGVANEAPIPSTMGETVALSPADAPSKPLRDRTLADKLRPLEKDIVDRLDRRRRKVQREKQMDRIRLQAMTYTVGRLRSRRAVNYTEEDNGMEEDGYGQSAADEDEDNRHQDQDYDEDDEESAEEDQSKRPLRRPYRMEAPRRQSSRLRVVAVAAQEAKDKEALEAMARRERSRRDAASAAAAALRQEARMERKSSKGRVGRGSAAGTGKSPTNEFDAGDEDDESEAKCSASNGSSKSESSIGDVSIHGFTDSEAEIEENMDKHRHMKNEGSIRNSPIGKRIRRAESSDDEDFLDLI